MLTGNVIQSLQAVVGSKHAFSSDDERSLPHRTIFGIPARRDTGFLAVALPGSSEQLQQLMQIVHNSGLSVWHTPNAAGNGATIEHGNKKGVVLDLQRMNRIIDVDASSACALVEPGVSYQQLYDHLRAKNIPLWIDCDRNPNHSIAGSICSRQVGYTPYGDHSLMQCGMEVVLADGEIVRTGMGALPKSDCWQLFKYNFGPYLDGLFAQSDLGIVSKIGLWLMPPPPVFKPFMVTLSRDADMTAMVEILRTLRINQAIPNPVTISNRAFESALSGDDSEGLGAWNVCGALYGAPENVDFLWGAVEAAFRSIPDARIYGKDDLPDHKSWQKRQKLMCGTPLQADLSFGHTAGARFLELTSAAPTEGSAAITMHHLVDKIIHNKQMTYLTEYVVAWRCMFKRIYLPYDDNDPASFTKVVDVAGSLTKSLTDAGYGIVHESLALRDSVDQHYAGSGLNKVVDRLRAKLAKT